MNQEFTAFIQKCESKFEKHVVGIVDDVISRNDKVVLITGGSCAGKTTTTKKLSHRLTARGKRVHCISLDDFFRFGAERVMLPSGMPDYESPASLRIDLIQSALSSLLDGKRTMLPRFDFVAERRIDNAHEITPDKSDIFLIEGLHAHNPLLIPSGAHGVFKLFLYAVPDDCPINPRIVRRLVRDSLYRGASAERTFELWTHVIAEEEKSIDPFAEEADYRFYTYLDYERDVLGQFALKELETLPKDSIYIPVAETIRHYLDGCGSIPVSAVPGNSLLREFI